MRTDQLTHDDTPPAGSTGVQAVLDLAGTAAPPAPPAVPEGDPGDSDGRDGDAVDSATPPSDGNGHLPDALRQWWAYWITAEDVPASQAHTRRVGAAYAASRLHGQTHTVLYLCGPAQHTNATTRQLQQLAADLPVEAVNYRLHQQTGAPDPRWTLVAPADYTTFTDNTHLPQINSLLGPPLAQTATSKRLTDAAITELAEYKWIPDAPRQAAGHLDAVTELSDGAAALLAMPTAGDDCFGLFAQAFAWLLSETAVNHPAGR